MGVKHKKLKEWVAADLMTEAQADAIHAYEEKAKGGRFGRGLVGLSLFAILVGVLSIIAANWYAIPGSVKIGVHALLNAGIGWLALRSAKDGNDLWREGAALAFMGLTFTLIILIGQVFQMTGTLADALLFWFLITLPFFLLMGRGYMTAVPWMLAFLTTLGVVMAEHLEELPKEERAFMFVGIAALLPLALMADGTIAIFKRLRPILSEVALKTGIVMSALFASASISFWPFFRSSSDEILLPQYAMIILAAGIAALSAHAFLHNMYRDDPAAKMGAIFAGVGLVAMVVPHLLPIAGLSIIAALVFIAYWAMIGWMAQAQHRMRIVSLAITIIAIRIFMIYVEVFGSLMNTGLGLISGGIVMLGLIYAARKMNKRITQKAALS